LRRKADFAPATSRRAAPRRSHEPPHADARDTGRVTNPPFSLPRIDPVAPRVHEVEASIAIVRRGLGSTVEPRDELGRVHLRAGASVHLRGPDGNRVGLKGTARQA